MCYNKNQGERNADDNYGG